MSASLVGSEMCIRDSVCARSARGWPLGRKPAPSALMAHGPSCFFGTAPGIPFATPSPGARAKMAPTAL
eukprot:10387960-Alexandrium_andersonii.AAC.1